MGIEKEISYHQFRSEYEKIIVNIYFTNNWLFEKYGQTLSKYNLTAQQYNVLKILHSAYPKTVTNSHIKERMLDRSSDITRIVERLLAKNFIARRRDQSNRRKVLIKLNVVGYHLMEKMNKEVQVFENLVKHLTPKEAIELNKLLDKVRK